MEVEAAKIEVDRADEGKFSVGQRELRMDEAGRVFVDADARGGQGLVIRARDRVDVPLIRHAGRYDADIEAGLCGGAERGEHFIVEDEIGRHQPDIAPCGANEALVHARADVFMVERAVSKRL